MRYLLVLWLCCVHLLLQAATPQKVYVFDLKDEIGPSALRMVQKAFDEAADQKADVILIRMNTYGGLLDKADSIRTRILHAPVPVLVFIDNNAASAGALIAIACNKIYMRKGSNIGAASVVNQSGELAPDKYQSYMRSMMRATAEARGRNPLIAEGMVDGKTVVPGINKEGQVITLTADEALKHGYCEGIAESTDEVLQAAGIQNYTLSEQRVSTLDRIISFLINPAISGVLILLILGGIYYEMQAPGLGFPAVVSIVAAVLYFAPLYLEELALNWEILVFFIGIVLVMLEVFFFPGFGVAGVSGIVLITGSLVLSMIRNVDFDFSLSSDEEVLRALLTVFFSISGFIVFLIVFGRTVMRSSPFQKMVLHTTLADAKAPVEPEQTFSLLQQTGLALTDIRPMGKADVNGNVVIVHSVSTFIPKGSRVQVVREGEGKYWVLPVN
jgi:membrane-bound serine protease (ClpP class)